MREAATMTPRQEEARAQALAMRGRALQEAANRRRMQPAPGRDPKTRGVTPENDGAEARRNAQKRLAAREAYLAQVQEEEKARRIIAAKEAKVAEKVRAYELQLRAKAGLPTR